LKILGFGGSPLAKPGRIEGVVKLTETPARELFKIEIYNLERDAFGGTMYTVTYRERRLPEEASDTRGRSDVIAELGLSGYRDWSVELAMQWDPDSSNTVLGQAAVQYRPARDTLVNVGYRYRDSRGEQWDAPHLPEVDTEIAAVRSHPGCCAGRPGSSPCRRR